MRSKLTLVITVFLWLTALPSTAAHTRVTLVLAADPAKAGDTVLAGIHMRMDQHHTPLVDMM